MYLYQFQLYLHLNYQLYNLLERYGMYVNWDIDIKSRLAGAKNDKKPENWMKPF